MSYSSRLWRYSKQLESCLFPPERIQTFFYAVHDQWLSHCKAHPVVDSQTGTVVHLLGTNSLFPESVQHVKDIWESTKPGLVLSDQPEDTLNATSAYKDTLKTSGQAGLWTHFYNSQSRMNDYCKWMQGTLDIDIVAECMIQSGIVSESHMRQFALFGILPHLHVLAALDMATEQKADLEFIGPPEELQDEWDCNIEFNFNEDRMKEFAQNGVDSNPHHGALSEWLDNSQSTLEKHFADVEDVQAIRYVQGNWVNLLYGPESSSSLRRELIQGYGESYIYHRFVMKEQHVAGRIRSLCETRGARSQGVLAIIDRRHVEHVRALLTRSSTE